MEPIVLDFGKYRGSRLTLEDLPLDYVIWLVGYRVSPEGHVEHHIDATVHAIWDNREAVCGCGCDPGVKQHVQSCYNFCLGRTREETRRNLLQSAGNGRATFTSAKVLGTWLHVQERHTDVVAAANRLLVGICWLCGGRLVPIGTSRLNGGPYHDRDERRFHVACGSIFA